ncbi:serine protein kinase RIO [Methanosarcinales archaeon]|nr:MAG: serine protein kinase RIO [Methanosarcinales archaeon]
MQHPISKKILKVEFGLEALRVKERDSDERKVTENVFDNATLKTLYHLSNSGHIKAFGGPISTGKEANVFQATGKDDREIAVKIYRISSSNFKAILGYIIGDHRFDNVKRTKKEIIIAWARKEFQNLLRARNAEIRVPKPVKVERNVLLMEFIGEDGIASPQLRDVRPTKKDAEKIFEEIIEYMRRLYQDAGMVHGDLSEYNILINSNNKPVIIDIGQGVLISHTRSREFLERDTNNIIRFFKKWGVNATDKEILTRITNIK